MDITTPTITNRLTHFEYKYKEYVNTISLKDLEEQAKQKNQKLTLTLSQWIMNEHNLSGFSFIK